MKTAKGKSVISWGPLKEISKYRDIYHISWNGETVSGYYFFPISHSPISNIHTSMSTLKPCTLAIFIKSEKVIARGLPTVYSLMSEFWVKVAGN